jgi:peptide/nickel transport system ATP-binding protein
MMQRVGVAMGLFFKPRLLLADEPTSALDVTTQAQVVKEMMALCRDTGTAIIIVTHNLGVAAYMADEIIVMRNGAVVDRGTSEELLRHSENDYTKTLLAAVPQIGGRGDG